LNGRASRMPPTSNEFIVLVAIASLLLAAIVSHRPQSGKGTARRR